MPLPAPQPYCRMAPNQSHCAACHAETVLSKAAVPSLPPLQRVSRRVLHRPAHRPRKQPSHQIAIGGYPTTPRGFLPWRLSDAGPQCQLINREWAGIRNPSQQPFDAWPVSGGSAPIADLLIAASQLTASTRGNHSVPLAKPALHGVDNPHRSSQMSSIRQPL
jgi:hypothetical protein